ncbi:MAG: filamentous hemagglutinin family protein [Burkholderiales bacterium]
MKHRGGRGDRNDWYSEFANAHDRYEVGQRRWLQDRGAGEVSLMVLAAAGALSLGVTPASLAQTAPLPRGTLPVPCAATGACGPKAPPNLAFVTSGQARYNVAGNTGTVTQTSNQAILNWQSFNIANGNAVKFVQPNAASTALNRIYDAAPSVIQGALSANGQVYLINQNGILFGAGAQVNVNSLVASSLNITDKDFLAGILGPIKEQVGAELGRPVFVPFRNADGSIDPSGAIRIEQGATLQSADGGRVAVFAPVIENRGDIRTPNGQTLLAAGNKIYLEGSSDPNLRGLLVEVDTEGDAPGTVANIGSIVAERGNATLIGMVVRQDGRITATTAVNANGSIRLLARNGAERPAAADIAPQVRVSTKGGSLTLGAGSVTEVLPDTNDAQTTIRSALFDDAGNLRNPSRVELMGKSISLEGGSSIVAPSGDVTLTAVADPRNYSELTRVLKQPDAQLHESRIELAAGSRIDVSGIESVAPMSRNEVKVELRGNELRDSPLQRDGFLRGKTVTIDARVGTKLADVQAALDNVPLDVSDRSLIGGTIALKSQGDVVARAGSALNVSGGAIRYLDGTITTTRLVSDNKFYDIGTAPADRIYQGIAGVYTRTVTTTSGRKVTDTWTTGNGASAGGQYQAGYIEGRNAGTIEIVGNGVVLDGELEGKTSVGANQRNPATQASAPAHTRLPLPGRLIVGAKEGTSAVAGSAPDYRTPDVLIRPGPSGAAGSGPIGGPLILSTEAIERGGIGRVEVYSNRDIQVAGDGALSVPSGGEVKLVGRTMDVQGKIDAPSGIITLETHAVVGDPLDTTHPLVLGAASALTARGAWVNDAVAGDTLPSAPLAIHGGTVTVKPAINDRIPGAVTGDFIQGSVIDVSGGAYLDTKGKLTKGNGGKIDLTLQALSPSTQSLAPTDNPLGVEVRGDALGKGGTLSVTASDVAIQAQGAPGAKGQLVLGDDFFANGGFTGYTVKGAAVTVKSGASIDVTASNLVLKDDAPTLPTGTSIRDVTLRARLPAAERSPTSIGLEVTPLYAAKYADIGALTVEAGASIRTEQRGQISARAPTRIMVDGKLDAPAGAIDLQLVRPPAAFDPGYLADRTIWFGSQANVSARGAVQETPNTRGLALGDVLSGGTVSLNAGSSGHVVTQKGSQIDVSGISADLNLINAPQGTLRTTSVAGRAGAIRINALDGFVLDGAMLGGAGGSTAAAGALAMQLTRDPGLAVQANELIVRAAGDAGLPPTATAVTGVPAALRNKGLVDAATIQGGGFDELNVASSGSVRFDSGVALTTRRSINVDTPTLAASGSGQVTLTSSYVAIGNTDPAAQAPVVPAPGSATVSVQGGWVDLLGNSGTSGIGKLSLTSSGDIRLRGIPAAFTRDLTGSLTTQGDLTLAARQIYPTTLSEFTIAAKDDPAAKNSDGTARGARIDIQQIGTPSPVLSAGGSVRLEAAAIDQNGTIRAPLGEIALQARDRLTLAPGSLTSVSAEGQIIPFGRTQNGIDWLYEVDGLQRDIRAEGLVQKGVRLAGASIDVQPGAHVDLSGGGDLYAYEFTPGPGGSRDVLANANSAGVPQNVYAILPSLQAEVAPHDYQESRLSNLKPGDGVTLSGANGLPAGKYALLPAHYALLPGAFLVTPVSGFADLQPGQNVRRTDGAEIVSGFRSAAGTDIRDSRTSGFLVRPGATARTQSEFSDSLGNRFFALDARAREITVPALPIDAGRLSIAAGQALTLDGAFSTDTPRGGRGAEVDISADKLLLASGNQSRAGFVQVDPTRIATLGAESVLVGGTRQTDGNGVRLNVAATQVVVAADTAVRAPEVILVAKELVSVEQGARVEGLGRPLTRALPIRIEGAGADADGALLRASSASQADIIRNAPARVNGTLDVSSGATVIGSGSIALDATRDTRFAGDMRAPGGAVSIGASRITIGEVGALPPTEGIAFTNADFSRQFADVRDLALRSYSSVDLVGEARVGGADLERLHIDAGGLRGVDNAGKSIEVAAREVSITNSSGAPTQVATGTGSLTIRATDRVLLGSGQKSIVGFGQTTIEAGNTLKAVDTGSLAVSGNLAINAGTITGGAGADQSIAATGAVRLDSIGAQGARSSELGARLAIDGARVDLDGKIDLPAGSVTISASGSAAADGVTIGNRGVIDVSGVEKAFFDRLAYADGGAVTLRSTAGSVAVQDGARIDVAAPAAGGDGGTLVLEAPAGQLRLGGAIFGASGIGGTGGTAKIDASSIADLSLVTNGLRDGGFSARQSIRQRTDAITIGANDILKAERIDLVADQGAITIAGRLDASSRRGGEIQLHARDAVTLAPSALLDAHATESTGKGGLVAIGTTNGALAIEAGSRIDVSRAGAAAGKVNLRAPRIGAGAGTDVAIASLAGTIDGAAQITAEGTKVYEGVGVIDAAAVATTGGAPTTWFNEAQSFAANAAAIRTRLGAAANPALQIVPGIELRGAGDMQLAADWSLHDWRFDRVTGAVELDPAALARGSNANGALAAGVLTMRAAGDLRFDGSLSDGFAGVLNSSRINDAGTAWSYRLIAGADVTSADARATVPLLQAPAGKGSVRVGAGVPPLETIRGGPAETSRHIRTGAGDIDIAAARDVVLESRQSVIYTSGVAADRRRPGQVALGGATFQIGDTAAQAENGGDVRIAAGGDVRSIRLPDDTRNQVITAWQHRDGNGGTAGQWWVDPRYFQQGIATLGGGDVSVHAGGNIDNISVAAATSKTATGPVLGGGDLTVVAGRDIKGGVFYVGRGKGAIVAGDNVASADVPNRIGGGVIATNPILGVADSKIGVKAGRNLTIESAVNPTFIPQTPEQSLSAVTNFLTYADDSAVRLTSTAGTVRLNASPDTMRNTFTLGLARSGISLNFGVNNAQSLTVLPPHVEATALQGSIELAGTSTLYPSAMGSLDLIADRDVRAGVGATLSLSDTNPAQLPRVDSPATGGSVQTAYSSELFNRLSPGNNSHAAVPVHGSPDGGVTPADPVPVRIYARQGSIEGGTYVFAKQARLEAGRDIADIQLTGQNITSRDTTSVVAGRDVVFNTPRDTNGNVLANNRSIDLSGPGQLIVRAGRDVDLGSSAGITTSGNVKNAALPSNGANIAVYAGAPTPAAEAALVARYITPFVDPANPSFGQGYADPGSVEVKTITASLRAARQDPLLSEAAVAAELAADPRKYASEVFFNELKLAGRDRNYARGFAAIDTLFPAAGASGDVNLFFSQMRTLAGGDIVIFAPRGAVNAGLASPPAGLTKTNDQLGIVVQDHGRVRAFVDGDFLVNQSRVFTLRGGDLLLWSSNGNIDAGKGAKSTVSAPPPVITVDERGNVTFRLSEAATGSGIRIQLTRAGDRAGDVDLIAPRGEVNAGDAGIGSAGNLNIAAIRVVGAENIQVSGVATGVPAADTSGLAGGLNLGNVAADATKSAERVSQAVTESSQSSQNIKQSFRPSLLSVEVMCLGDDCRLK